MRGVLGLCVSVLLAFTAMSAVACQGNVFSLKLGDCFNGSASGTISDVSVIDCAKAHDAEVFSIFSYPGPGSSATAPSDYPGDDAMRSAAKAGCAPAFQTFVGIDYNESSYGLSFLRPTADSWKTGDRTFDCLVVSATDGQQLTGSAKGTAK